jgi:hypothetical protein
MRGDHEQQPATSVNLTAEERAPKEVAPWWVRWLFLVALPALFMQLPLRYFTEPYPADLLPAGAGLLESRGEYTAREITLSVETGSGNEIPVSASALLDTVPTNYHPYVINRGFGINRDRDIRSVRIPLPGGTTTFRPVQPITREQIAETRTWLRNRVKRALGVDPVRIHILHYDVTVIYREEPAQRLRTLHHRETVELIE